jgi:hypothetical protein
MAPALSTTSANGTTAGNTHSATHHARRGLPPSGRPLLLAFPAAIAILTADHHSSPGLLSASASYTATATSPVPHHPPPYHHQTSRANSPGPLSLPRSASSPPHGQTPDTSTTASDASTPVLAATMAPVPILTSSTPHDPSASSLPSRPHRPHRPAALQSAVASPAPLTASAACHLRPVASMHRRLRPSPLLSLPVTGRWLCGKAWRGGRGDG